MLQVTDLWARGCGCCSGSGHKTSADQRTPVKSGRQETRVEAGEATTKGAAHPRWPHSASPAGPRTLPGMPGDGGGGCRAQGARAAAMSICNSR